MSRSNPVLPRIPPLKQNNTFESKKPNERELKYKRPSQLTEINLKNKNVPKLEMKPLLIEDPIDTEKELSSIRMQENTNVSAQQLRTHLQDRPINSSQANNFSSEMVMMLRQDGEDEQMMIDESQPSQLAPSQLVQSQMTRNPAMHGRSHSNQFSKQQNMSKQNEWDLLGQQQKESGFGDNEIIFNTGMID